VKLHGVESMLQPKFLATMHRRGKGMVTEFVHLHPCNIKILHRFYDG